MWHHLFLLLCIDTHLCPYLAASICCGKDGHPVTEGMSFPCKSKEGIGNNCDTHFEVMFLLEAVPFCQRSFWVVLIHPPGIARASLHFLCQLLPDRPNNQIFVPGHENVWFGAMNFLSFAFGRLLRKESHRGQIFCVGIGASFWANNSSSVAFGSS